MTPKERLLKVRISDSLKNRIDKYSEESGETISAVVRSALQYYMDRGDMGDKLRREMDEKQEYVTRRLEQLEEELRKKEEG